MGCTESNQGEAATDMHYIWEEKSSIHQPINPSIRQFLLYVWGSHTQIHVKVHLTFLTTNCMAITQSSAYILNQNATIPTSAHPASLQFLLIACSSREWIGNHMRPKKKVVNVTPNLSWDEISKPKWKVHISSIGRRWWSYNSANNNLLPPSTHK